MKIFVIINMIVSTSRTVPLCDSDNSSGEIIAGCGSLLILVTRKIGILEIKSLIETFGSTLSYAACLANSAMLDLRKAFIILAMHFSTVSIVLNSAQSMIQIHITKTECKVHTNGVSRDTIIPYNYWYCHILLQHLLHVYSHDSQIHYDDNQKCLIQLNYS